jgi:6-phosphofructokinase 1
VNACDSIKLSANASRQRVFVVEVHGGNCGYLSTLSGLTVGAVSAYIPEENLTLATLSDDVRYLIKRYKDEQADGYHNEGRVILRSENCIPSVYSTKFISEMLRAEGKGFFDSREAILGHLQQGDVPSPLDRIRATKMAVKAIDFIQEITQNCNESGKCYENYTADDSNAVVIGIQGAELVATPVVVAKKLANMAKRTTVCEWWVPLRKLIKILGKREYSSL